MRVLCSKVEALQELNREITSCRLCGLWRGRTRAVPGEGSPAARVMFVGESPGKEEDIQGRPFVGRSGRLLDSLSRQIGLDRRRVYITSVLKCRPPGNRPPRGDEIRACKPFLERQISVVDPEVIVLLGSVASKTLLGKGRVASLHGTFLEAEGRKYFVTYHPAAGLRFPMIRKELEVDFRKIGEVVGKSSECAWRTWIVGQG